MSDSILCGLIGTGIEASLTPVMHEEEGRRQGLPYVYRILDLDVMGMVPSDIGELLTYARRFGFRGLNITHPCKQLVIEHLDELSPDADRLGAVNTVLFDCGKAIGHNTDWSGFGRNFDDGLPGAQLDRVVQLGAGGAGAAIGGLFGSVGALVGGSLSAKEASTLLTLIDNRSGVQLAAAEGSAKNTDFGAREEAQ